MQVRPVGYEGTERADWEKVVGMEYFRDTATKIAQLFINLGLWQVVG